MIIHKPKLLLSLVILFVVTTIGWPTHTVAAADMPPTKGLTLSPVRSEMEIEPGRSLDRTLKLINYSDHSMTIRLSAEKFSVINQQYDYAFSTDSDVSKWVTFAIDEVKLDPGKSERVPYTIGVPLTAEPGGRYISLFAMTDTMVGDNGVQSRQRIASLVYLTVKGKVSRTGRVVSLTSPWAVTGPSTWSVAVQNSGTTHFRSRYTVEVQNAFTNQKIATTMGDALILPGSVRLLSDAVPLPNLLGVYKLVYTIGLGDTPAVTQTRSILYVPWWALSILVVIILLLIWVPIRILRKR